MTKTIKRATVILAALALPLTSCATPTGVASPNEVSSLGAPETDHGSLSVKLDSGREAEIEIRRYKSVRTTWAEMPALLGNCSLKHGSYDQKAVAVHVVEIEGKATFTAEGRGPPLAGGPLCLRVDSDVGDYLVHYWYQEPQPPSG